MKFKLWDKYELECPKTLVQYGSWPCPTRSVPSTSDRTVCQLTNSKQVFKLNHLLSTSVFGLSSFGIAIKYTINGKKAKTVSNVHILSAGLGGSVGCAVRLETRRSRVQPPPRSATFFRGDWSWNIFYGHSLPSADSRRAVVSFWRKNVHNTG